MTVLFRVNKNWYYGIREGEYFIHRELTFHVINVAEYRVL